MEGEEGEMKWYDWFFCTRKLAKADVEAKSGTKL
jgi:peroxiredoxin (alkyl hydroperoxide reductase subunit C)